MGWGVKKKQVAIWESERGFLVKIRPVSPHFGHHFGHHFGLCFEPVFPHYHQFSPPSSPKGRPGVPDNPTYLIIPISTYEKGNALMDHRPQQRQESCQDLRYVSCVYGNDEVSGSGQVCVCPQGGVYPSGNG